MTGLPAAPRMRERRITESMKPCPHEARAAAPVRTESRSHPCETCHHHVERAEGPGGYFRTYHVKSRVVLTPLEPLSEHEPWRGEVEWVSRVGAVVVTIASPRVGSMWRLRRQGGEGGNDEFTGAVVVGGREQRGLTNLVRVGFIAEPDLLLALGVPQEGLDGESADACPYPLCGAYVGGGDADGLEA